ncbi:MAG TPA: hypothetical protein VN577_05265 [Terriglobales bacterium]|nr:hypothetical protein [Terriglobales bacterium]
MITVIIPTADPMPLPAPVWLLKSLLLLTFFLHLLAMNMVVGGGLIALISRIRGRSNELAHILGTRLAAVLPVLLAGTITLGVAALLFVQVLYGQLFYTSSILLGVAWLSVILLLLIGYYGFYWSNLRQSMTGAVLGVLMVFTIGFIYVNNMTLMLTPERWADMYRANAAGLHLNIGEVSLIPRYLHMAISGIAFGGLLVVLLALRETEAKVRDWMLRQGALWFTIPTVVNFGIGFWFLLAIPRDVRMLFMGQSPLASALLLIGFLLPVAAIVHLMLALSGRKPARQAIAGIASAVLTVAVMIAMRDVVRTGYLNGVFNPHELAVVPQWSVIGIFLVLFVAGLATLFWMLRKVVTAKGSADLARHAAQH